MRILFGLYTERQLKRLVPFGDKDILVTRPRHIIGKSQGQEPGTRYDLIADVFLRNLPSAAFLHPELSSTGARAEWICYQNRFLSYSFDERGENSLLSPVEGFKPKSFVVVDSNDKKATEKLARRSGQSDN